MFFIAPGPWTFDLFATGFDARLLTWLLVVMTGTAIAGLRGRLPGCEPAPYIIRFTEDRPNPLYRRICYTTAWGEVVAFAVLNIAGLVWAVVTGEWHLRQMYDVGVFSDRRHDVGARRPREAAPGEAVHAERRARAALFLRFGLGGGDRATDPMGLWKFLPAHNRMADVTKLAVFVGVLAFVGHLSRRGILPRTRPIVPASWRDSRTAIDRWPKVTKAGTTTRRSTTGRTRGRWAAATCRSGATSPCMPVARCSNSAAAPDGLRCRSAARACTSSASIGPTRCWRGPGRASSARAMAGRIDLIRGDIRYLPFAAAGAPCRARLAGCTTRTRRSRFDFRW